MEDFEKITQWLKLLGFEIVLFIAGIMGAFVSVVSDKRLTKFERITSVISGGIIANYMTPIILEIIKLSTASSYGTAFLIGYSGLKIVEYTITFIHQKLGHYEKPLDNKDIE